MRTKTRQRLIVVSLFFAALVSLALVGCGGDGNTTPSQSDDKTGDSTPSKDAIKIDDILWSVDGIIEDGYRRVAMQYVNNTDYVIANVQMEFRVKPDASDEQLESAFASMKDETWCPDPVGDVKQDGMWCECPIPVEPGGSSAPGTLEVGITYINDIAQYELMDLDMIRIQYISEGKMYEEYYDFKSDSYSLSQTVIDVNQWSDSEMSALVPRFSSGYVVDINDFTDQFSFDAIGVTQEEFEAYVEECKGMGFTTDPTFTDSTYYAEDSEGLYDFSLFYSADHQKMNLILNRNNQ
ncbi:DUF6591 domain-containing protein [Adlercreutzia sp. ZJ141]|uniref:DUF6591 domain-containing protein n=1 Tax=Adlercreutzia sp. ZJ141 TaxID=2709406 RepID=UPI0013EC4128|nr:DUF6591 domain-containing protein [Adlercreutzia sp. ZJ141]